MFLGHAERHSRSRAALPGESLSCGHRRRDSGSMPSVQIKDVPTDTHAVLRRRATAAQQSLQDYLRNQLIEQASSSAAATTGCPDPGAGRRIVCQSSTP